MALLQLAADDPECPIQRDWPILRVARLDPLDGLRCAEFTTLWCLVWIAVARSLACGFEEQPLDAEAEDMAQRILALRPRLRAILLLVMSLVESGANLEAIGHFARMLIDAETGNPS